MAGRKASFERFKGKIVELVFQDSASSIAKREGKLLDYDSKFVTIENKDKLSEIIPSSRIIRIKELKEERK